MGGHIGKFTVITVIPKDLVFEIKEISMTVNDSGTWKRERISSDAAC
jgi:hypothetical protein